MTTDYQLFDPLPQPIEDALRASIKKFGVLMPIVVDEDGNVIDGNHRRRIADEESVKYDIAVPLDRKLSGPCAWNAIKLPIRDALGGPEPSGQRIQ